MSGDAWARVGDVPPAALADATLEVHWAVQVLAGAGQTFVAPRPDDSHRGMVWDPTLQGFLGEAFSDGYPFRVGLRPDDLTLHLLDRTGSTLGALALGGVGMEDAWTWLRAGLSQYMGGTGPEIGRPDFEIPAHRVGEGAPFAVDRDRERATLAALYGGAAELLDDVARSFVSGDSPFRSASPVRCWPHHFDIATLLTLREARGDEPARTVGVGMAPMGGGYDAWYWYVTPWPYPARSRLAALTAPASWHTEGWTGAVLKGADVVDVPDERRQGLVRSFVDEATAAAAAALDED